MDKSGIRMVSSGDITADDDLPTMTNALIGFVTAHHYSVLHDSTINKAYVDAFRKTYGMRPAFHSVAGYGAMHLLHQALEKTGGDTSGDALIAALWLHKQTSSAARPETDYFRQSPF